jgi:ABC-type uncharacterized transport system permease subunit
LFDDIARVVGHLADTKIIIGMVIISLAAVVVGEQFVNTIAPYMRGNSCIRGILLLDFLRSRVIEARRAGGSSLLDATAEAVIFEGIREQKGGQRKCGSPLFSVELEVR